MMDMLLERWHERLAEWMNIKMVIGFFEIVQRMSENKKRDLKTDHVAQGQQATLRKTVDGFHVSAVLQRKSADIGIG